MLHSGLQLKLWAASKKWTTQWTHVGLVELFFDVDLLTVNPHLGDLRKGPTLRGGRILIAHFFKDVISTGLKLASVPRLLPAFRMLYAEKRWCAKSSVGWTQGTRLLETNLAPRPLPVWAWRSRELHGHFRLVSPASPSHSAAFSSQTRGGRVWPTAYTRLDPRLHNFWNVILKMWRNGLCGARARTKGTLRISSLRERTWRNTHALIWLASQDLGWWIQTAVGQTLPPRFVN